MRPPSSRVGEIQTPEFSEFSLGMDAVSNKNILQGSDDFKALLAALGGTRSRAECSRQSAAQQKATSFDNLSQLSLSRAPARCWLAPTHSLTANVIKTFFRYMAIGIAGNADDCRRKAEDTDDPDDKTSWLKLADAWLQMLPPMHSAGTDLAGWPKASDAHSKASH
jgi:hypothetical protein